MDVDKDIKQNNNSIIGVRHIQMLLMFFGLLFFFALRANISIAIVVMADSTDEKWNFTIQSIILSSFFWGYAFGQIPAGQLAQKFGPKILLLIMMILCSFLNLLTPIAASYGWQYVCFLRVLQGLTQSFLLPCTHIMISKWAPLLERARMSTFCYAGSPLGFVFMYAISGFLASSTMGWPSIFYVSGLCGILWAILWFLYGCNSPGESKSISDSEKDLIELSKGTSTISRLDVSKTPWIAIFTSLPFLSLIITHFTSNWGSVALLTLLPTYMKNILHLDITENSLYNTLPLLINWLLSIPFSILSDFLMNKQILNAEQSRKIYNSIGAYGAMICLIGLGYVNDVTSAISILCITGALSGASYVGYYLNHIDLAPNFAGTLMSITNFFAAISSIVAPLVSGAIIDINPNDLIQWRITFYIVGIMLFLGNTLFVIFGKGEIQKWNNI